jgi:hypothetical protein
MKQPMLPSSDDDSEDAKLAAKTIANLGTETVRRDDGADPFKIQRIVGDFSPTEPGSKARAEFDTLVSKLAAATIGGQFDTLLQYKQPNFDMGMSGTHALTAKAEDQLARILIICCKGKAANAIRGLQDQRKGSTIFCKLRDKFAVVDDSGIEARALLARLRYTDHDGIDELSEKFDDHTSDYRLAAGHDLDRSQQKEYLLDALNVDVGNAPESLRVLYAQLVLTAPDGTVSFADMMRTTRTYCKRLERRGLVRRDNMTVGGFALETQMTCRLCGGKGHDHGVGGVKCPSVSHDNNSNRGGHGGHGSRGGRNGRGGHGDQHGRGRNALYCEYHQVSGHDKNTCRERPAGWKVGDTPKTRWADRRNGLAAATRDKPDDSESVCDEYQLPQGIFALSDQHEGDESPTHASL